MIDQKGKQIGIVALEEAKTRAEKTGLDLVEIVPSAEPPVCRIMDYGKHLFVLNKKKHAAKKKQKQIQVKEIKLRPGTDKGDYCVKIKNLTRFLNSGDKVKVTLQFRGRELAHQELGEKMLEKVEQDLQDIAVVEQFPKLEGRHMVMVVAPKR